MSSTFASGTGASTQTDPTRAINDAWAHMIAKVPSPSLVLVSSTVGYDLTAVHAALAELAGDTPFMGGTSCGGVMTDEGFFGVEGRGLALFALSDADGAFGVGAAPIGDDPRGAARRAVEAALADAGCEGQLPSAVWLITSPGGEEAVVQGIADVFGGDIPLVGGSAADNTLEGHWRQFSPAGVLENHVCVAVLFSSGGVTTSFHSGYDPTTQQGTITEASGRMVYAIDGKPAAQVYNEWTGGAITDALAGGGEILSKTNLSPLGRPLCELRGVPYFVLSHPEQVTPEGAMRLFTDVSAGEKLVCMTGSVDNLVARAANVVRSALTNADMSQEHARGALIIFCGGCFLTVQDRIDEVHANIRRELGAIPFMTTFTFGEQGRIVDVGNRHGNLMISTLMLTD